MSEPHTPSTATRVDVYASLSMETRLRSACSYNGFRFPGRAQVSQETQQLDEVHELKTLAAHHENIRRLLKAEKPTGTAQLFVLDPEKLAVGDIDAHSTLQALANTQFTNSTHAAVAMLPPESGFSQAGQMSATLLKDTVLSNLNIVTLESLTQVESWLENLNSTVGSDR